MRWTKYRVGSNGERFDAIGTADLTIDLRTIDTSQYSGMYRFWSEVPLYRFKESPIMDADHDNLKEVYGGFKDYTTPMLYSRIYEFDGDSGFVFSHQYPDSIRGPMAGADIDGDSLADLVYYDWPLLLAYTQVNQQTLPTLEKFSYNLGGEVYDGKVSFYDLTSDGLPEMVYQRIGNADSAHPCGQSVYVESYDSAMNSFRVLYCDPPLRHREGYALGDFDSDGKQNFSEGSTIGELFIHEHQAGDSFSVQLVDTLAASALFLATVTNDLDSNGKLELWVGGTAYPGGVPATQLFLLEANGNDSYQIVYQIDVLGGQPGFADNMVVRDMDNDGKDEVILCIDQYVLVFRNTGSASYALWYMRTNELADAGLNSVIYNATAADFDNDGYPEILVTMDHIRIPGELRFFTRVYKFGGPTAVPNEHTLPSVYKLEQNYPNPFNSQTIIKYELPKGSQVIVRVYDLLGREVRNLRNTQEDQGRHAVLWDGKDNAGRELPSGVYLVRLQADGVARDVKSMILR